MKTSNRRSWEVSDSYSVRLIHHLVWKPGRFNERHLPECILKLLSTNLSMKGYPCLIQHLLLILVAKYCIDQRTFAGARNITNHYKNIEEVIHDRHSILKQIARSKLEGFYRGDCNTSSVVVITKGQYGNSGNNLIELTNMIWLASVLNSTLMIPQYMRGFLNEFDLSILNEVYCLRFMPSDADFLSENDLLQILPIGIKNRKVYEIEAETSFFAFKLFSNHSISHLLPKYDNDLRNILSRHYLKVFSALWSSPAEYIISSTKYIISNYLDGNFEFTSVHKRSLEGACSKLLSASLEPSDFSAEELPMDSKEWSADLASNFPLCEMTGSFVAATLYLNDRQAHKLFVSYDGQGDASTLKALGAVFSSALDSSKKKKNRKRKHSHIEKKYIDILVAAHGAFFVLNPISTFSWQVFVVRKCLGLDSVPLLTDNDFYLQTRKHFKISNRDGLWVSFVSIAEAANDIRKSLELVE